MPNKNEKFLIEVKADINQAVTEMKKLTSELKSTGDAGKRSGAGVNALSGGMRSLVAAAGAYIGLQTVKQILMEADAWNQLQVRIRTATRETGDYNEVSKALFGITQRNGQAMETTVALFQNLARTAPELQATNQDMLALTNTVQQLGIISGTSQANMRAGLLQFTQGLAAGVFRAEEWNSIVENMPELANRIAKGMGLTVGQLRLAVLEGKVLSKDVFDSIQKQSGDIAEQFKEIPDSLARSSTALSNSFASFLSAIDNSVGVTKRLNSLLRDSALILDHLAEEETNLSRLQRRSAELQEQLDGMSEKGSRRAIQRYQQVQRELKLVNEEIEQEIELNRAIAQEDALNQPEAKSPAQAISPEASKAAAEYQKRLQAIRAEVAPLAAESQELAAKVETLNEALGKGDITQEQFAESVRSLAEHSSLAVAEQERLAEAERKAAEAAAAEEKAIQQLIDRLDPAAKATEKMHKELAILDQLFLNGDISGEYHEKLVEALTTGKEKIKDLADSGSEDLKRLEAAVEGWGNQFTNTLTDMVMSGKADFSALADSIIRDLIRIQIKKQIVTPFLEGLDLFPSSTSPAGGTPYVPLTVSHSGGRAGRSGRHRFIDPGILNAAPRYHSGGIAGLRPREVPAILEAGEEVLTRDDPRHIANQKSGDVRVEVINKGQPIEAQNAEASVDANGLVVRVFTQDLQRGGPMSRSMQSTFNLKR